MNVNKTKILFYLLSFAALLSVASAQVSQITSTICGFVSGVRGIIGFLAIALFLVGGAIYAVAHFLPTSLEYRKSLTGWATAMIVGSIIALVIVLLAYPLVAFFINVFSALPNTGPSIALAGC